MSSSCCLTGVRSDHGSIQAAPPNGRTDDWNHKKGYGDLGAMAGDCPSIPLSGDTLR